ncbi:Glycosyl transferase, family 54 [Cordyceps fumosorosea ARSEF 2679]|uniref:Glycosyl transferase, family 54 n=1 Tax=Cordyceps fumosorosea (strain ARSEF 2679) TaxID=1081104 RepID=A0A167ZG42_CORFA|nr:Glycosyl transferase, family 54 [Cordyceps fumosorosea ARSEF 2679]OAA67475.1 Glycosyl transferase, family 54 [Cordyceps fumosorosea ARSEF 2679]
MGPVSRANLAFWLLWLAALFWCGRNSFDDPSSIFYDQAAAYTQRYSALRGLEIDAFLANDTRVAAARPPDHHDEILCVGVPSINRTSEGFLARTVGGLVDGLTPAERASLHVVVLLADKTPAAHFAYGQPWLTAVVDEVLVYEQAGKDHSALPGYRTIPFEIRPDGRRRGDGRVENMRLDHSVLVETCRARGAPYFAFVEDDIVTSPDWYRKFLEGVARLELRTKRAPDRDWVYLRLFYSEIFMGWNAEEWATYAEVIFLVYAAFIVGFLVLRGRQRRRLAAAPSGYSPLMSKEEPAAARSAQSQRHLQKFNHLSAMVIGLWLPAAIALVFLGGRITMRRLSPVPRPGIREMPRYGCCAQGLVIPKRHLPTFYSLLLDPPYDFPGDMMLEGHADQKNLAKWALEPSVMQHVGLKQSSEGTRLAEVWNFSFERRTMATKNG